MEYLRAKLKLRKAIWEDFIWLDPAGNKRMKMGFPYYELRDKKELFYGFINLKTGDEKRAMENDIKSKINAGLIFVFEPEFSKDKRLLIEQ